MSIDTTTWLCGSPPATGQFQRYPGRFDFNLRRTYPELLAGDVLHMFSGSSRSGVTTDMRPETGADIIAPFDAIPCPDDSFSGVLADPPYADHWQGQWHGDLPKPKHILREAARLTRPGGLIAILHIIIIPAYREFGVQRIALHPVLTGPNNAIRVLNVFRVLAAPLPKEADMTDDASEYGRLLAERDRLIEDGADPAELEMPLRPQGDIMTTERITDDNGDETEHGDPDFPGQFPDPMTREDPVSPEEQRKRLIGAIRYLTGWDEPGLAVANDWLLSYEAALAASPADGAGVDEPKDYRVGYRHGYQAALRDVKP